MSEMTFEWSRMAPGRPQVAVAATAAALTAIAYGPGALGFGSGPNWSLLAREDLALQVHLGAAIGALLIGTLLMAGVKGRAWHKRLGWAWVVAMTVTAASSFWLQRLQPGSLSWIHALSGWTLVVLPAAVYAARRKRLKVHRREMMGLFYGGLIVAGLFALMPGRLLWALVLGHG